MATREATQGASEAPKRNGTGRGRPHDLDRPIPQPDAEPIPASDAIVRQVRTGLPLAEAAQSIGVDRSTAYRWRGDGASVLSQLDENRLDPATLTPYQSATAAFYDAVTRAEAEAHSLYTGRLSTLARGGFVSRREVIDYDKDGEEIGRRVTETTLPPDTKAVTFALERRWPQQWGRAQRIELAAGTDGPVVQTESPLARVMDALETIERRQAEGEAALASVVEIQQPEEDTA